MHVVYNSFSQSRASRDSCIFLNHFYQDDGTARVFVVGARGATGFVLTVGSEVFEESGRSLVRGTLDYLQGLKVSHVLQFLIIFQLDLESSLFMLIDG